MQDQDKVDPRLNWEHYKQIELEMLKTKHIICNRADTAFDLRNIYKAYYDFYPSWNELVDVVGWVREAVCSMTEAVEALTFEDMEVEEFNDPYEKLLIGFDGCQNYDELFKAYVLFGVIRPFGERLLNAHRLVQQDIKAASNEQEDPE